MPIADQTSTRQKNKHWGKIAAAGLLTGVLDFAFAMTLWGARGVSAEIIPKSVASGILGPAAFDGGSETVIAGTLLHLSMTTTMAAIYAAAPRRLKSSPFIAGPLYGAAIWVVMNKVVVPLSAAPLQPPSPPVQLADLAAHILLVGLPIALMARPAPQANAH